MLLLPSPHAYQHRGREDESYTTTVYSQRESCDLIVKLRDHNPLGHPSMSYIRTHLLIGKPICFELPSQDSGRSPGCDTAKPCQTVACGSSSLMNVEQRGTLEHKTSSKPLCSS
jgi:hypothetical protein